VGVDVSQIGLGLLLSTAIGGLAYWRQSLTMGGWAGAIVTGTATMGFGGWAWGLALIAFFVSSSALSHYKERIKEQRAAEKFAKGGGATWPRPWPMAASGRCWPCSTPCSAGRRCCWPSSSA